MATKYKGRGVEFLVIGTGEPKNLTTRLVKEARFTLPVLLDRDGAVATAYNPGVMPDLKVSEVAIAANLIIDPEGKIQFYSLLDSKQFDARLNKLQQRLDHLLQAALKATKPGA